MIRRRQSCLWRCGGGRRVMMKRRGTRGRSRHGGLIRGWGLGQRVNRTVREEQRSTMMKNRMWTICCHQWREGSTIMIGFLLLLELLCFLHLMEMSLNQPCWLQEAVTWLDQPLQLRLQGFQWHNLRAITQDRQEAVQ